MSGDIIDGFEIFPDVFTLQEEVEFVDLIETKYFKNRKREGSGKFMSQTLGDSIPELFDQFVQRLRTLFTSTTVLGSMYIIKYPPGITSVP